MGILNLFKNSYGDFCPYRIGGTAAAAVIGFLVLNPIVIVQPGERMVVTRLGKALPGSLGEGLHVKLPFLDKLTKFDTRIQKTEIEGSAFSKDVQEVNTKITVQWQVTPAQVTQVFQEVKNLANAEDRIIKVAVNEEVKAALAKQNAETIIGDRLKIKENIVNGVTQRLQQRGLNVIAGGVNLDNIDFTDQFEKSIEEKQIAEQDAKKAKFIAQKAEQEAQADINRAKGKAEAARLEAEALKANGGEQVLQKIALDKWDGNLPDTLIMGEADGSIPAMILNQK